MSTSYELIVVRNAAMRALALNFPCFILLYAMTVGRLSQKCVTGWIDSRIMGAKCSITSFAPKHSASQGSQRCWLLFRHAEKNPPWYMVSFPSSPVLMNSSLPLKDKHSQYFFFRFFFGPKPTTKCNSNKIQKIQK